MRTTLRNGATLTCDLNKCRHPGFVTYSVVTMARPQAIDAGWGRIQLNRLASWQTLEMGSDGRRKLDVCPPHKVAIEEAYAARQKLTAEEKVKERADRKAAKLAEKAKAKQDKKDGRAAAKLKKKQDKADARAAAKAEARATKKQRSKKVGV